LDPLYEPAAGPRPEAARLQPPLADLRRLRGRALAAGVLGLGLCAAGYFTSAATLYRAWLVAFLFWSGVAAGSLAVALLHHLSRGAWGLVIRRVLEAAARTLPVVALLFVPIALGLGELYEWARPEAVAADELLRHKAPYLNPAFFLLRAAGYFLLWAGFAFLLDRLSRRQDETGEPRLFRRMQTLAGPGIVVYGLTATLAGVDWLMSLDARWFSSLYGLYFVIGQAVTALAFVILVETWLARRPPMDGVLQPRHLHDHGKLLLAFVMVWAYFAYSQFLIIWSGNLPEETVFYHRRLHGGWQWLSLAVLVLHFALPFVLLLSRDWKRAARPLQAIAALVLGARWLDLYWQAVPSLHPGAATFSWLDPAAMLAVGGLWLAAFFDQLARRTLLPVNDPYIVEALEHE
jgi:hypothetical protein